jgi:hypothetical protein
MKKIGYILIAAGFLGGALTAVLHTTEVRWTGFIIAAVIGAAGIAIVRIITSRAATEEGTLAGNITNIHESLARIVEKITKLNQEKESINPYDLRHRIDELFPEDLATFVEAREAIGSATSIACGPLPPMAISTSAIPIWKRPGSSFLRPWTLSRNSRQKALNRFGFLQISHS